MSISASLVKELREKTGAGMMDCKKALAESDGDLTAAVDYLRRKGLAAASKKAGRATREGLIGSYIHSNNKIGVLVEVACETDFVARTDDFKALVKDIAMHIAASAPEYVRREDVPDAAIEREKAIQRQRVIEEGKPEHIADRIVEGRMGKYFQDVCLLEQKFVKDDKRNVRKVVAETGKAMGAELTVESFVRFAIGE